MAYSSRAGSFRPAALVSGLKGRRGDHHDDGVIFRTDLFFVIVLFLIETVAIMQQEITNQLRRPLHERKKLKEASV